MIIKGPYTIGEYSSWMLASCEKGHAVSVPADDLLDAGLLGATLEEMQSAANIRANSLCETCKAEASK